MPQFSNPAEGLPIVTRLVNEAAQRSPTLEGRYRPLTIKGRFDDISELGVCVRNALSAISKAAGKPLAVFFDEVDCLSDDTLITFLRQLRDGYVNRNEIPFPASVALVGMRNIQDFKVRVRPDSDMLGTASPFNVLAATRTS